MISPGDRYQWRGIRITVTDVDPGGRRAVIHCAVDHETWDHKHYTTEWDKEQPTPGGEFPADWTRVTGEFTVLPLPPRAGPCHHDGMIPDRGAGASRRLEWLTAEIQVRHLLLQLCPDFAEARRLWLADIAALSGEAFRLLSPPPPPPPRASRLRRLLRRLRRVHVSGPRSRRAGQGPLPAGHYAARRRGAVSCARQQP